MFKKVLLASVLAASSFSSMANWVGGLSYVNMSEDDLDLSVGALVGSISYQVEQENGLSILPTFRAGFGISDDTVFGVDLELDSFYAFSVRGQYMASPELYLFVEPSYANAEFTASSGGVSETEDDWEFGLGGGLGYNFSSQAAVEFQYEQYDGTDVLSFGLKVDF
ncbi:outer membrane beta-barrel protein [Gayadomonas joobiniege]|uniref:outer membrane beta-barrel protein n=1 Tax=Gayadomonas joobiniege TaxID=1234606 RepID=UPI0003678F8F|nr:outer membrane beta-barrel protein [Gayadomonas joobiniege]